MDRTSPEFDVAVRRGSLGALAAHAAAQLLSLGVLAVLCRWVEPAEFGLFGTALLIVTLPRMAATIGCSTAVVQRPDATAEQLSSVFWRNLAAAVACAAIAAAVGGGLAIGSGVARLAPLAAALGGTVVVAAAGVVHQALLERRLALPALQRARLVAQLAGSIAALAAAMGELQAWALVVQQYAELSVLTVLAWRLEAWRPDRPSLAASSGELTRLGRYATLTNIVFYIGQNFDKLLLYVGLSGTASGRAVIGMYQLAFNLMMRPVYLATTPLSGVMLPALARAAGDPARYAELAIRFLRLCGLGLLPAGVGLWLVAPDAALVLAGDDWVETGRLLRALAPVLLVQGFINLCGSLLTSAGRVRELFIGALAVSLLLIQGCLAGYWLGGRFGSSPSGEAFGVACGFSVVTVAALFGPYLTYCLAQVGLSWRAVFGPLLPALAGASAMAVVVGLLQRSELGGAGWPPAARLTLHVAAGAVAYAWFVRRELVWARSVLTAGK